MQQGETLTVDTTNQGYYYFMEGIVDLDLPWCYDMGENISAWSQDVKHLSAYDTKANIIRLYNRETITCHTGGKDGTCVLQVSKEEPINFMSHQVYGYGSTYNRDVKIRLRAQSWN